MTIKNGKECPDMGFGYMTSIKTQYPGKGDVWVFATALKFDAMEDAQPHSRIISPITFSENVRLDNVSMAMICGAGACPK